MSTQNSTAGKTQHCTFCSREHPIEFFRKNGKYEHSGEQRYYNQCKYSKLGKTPPDEGSTVALQVQPDLQSERSSEADITSKRIVEPKRRTPERSIEPTPTPERIIEPQNSIGERLIEPENSEKVQSDSDVDYSLWERGYGRSLTDDEKRGIKCRMTEFFKLLIEEDSKRVTSNE